MVEGNLILGNYQLFFFILFNFVISNCRDSPSGCSLPLTPHNGNFEVEGCEGVRKDPFFGPCWKDPHTKYPVGQIVKYFCLPEFTLRGSNRIECLESGYWNASFPRCCRPKRATPAPIQTGQLDLMDLRANQPKNKLEVFEEARERRFEKVAEDSISCPPLQRTKNVEFECLTPDGRINNCENPPLPPYTVAHLKCARYYKSTDHLAYRYRKCKPDATWSTEGSIVCVPECGKSDIAKKPLITHGEPTERGQWPWHAALYVRDKGNWEFICGGSLISTQALITAAHCVVLNKSKLEKDRLKVVLGKFKRQYERKESDMQEKAIQQIIVHPNYSTDNYDSDIAILVLESPVKLSFYVRPVCFPESFNSLIEEYQIQDGNYGTVVGWGLDEGGKLVDDLHMAQLPVVSSRTCIDSFQEFFETQARYTNFCAGYTNGTGVCNGDSGGGMVFPSGAAQDLRWYIQGIVSVGAPDPNDKFKCNSRQYSLFTRVGRYSDWIVRTLSVDGYL